MKRIHILLIEDNRLLREWLTVMLKEQPNFKVVAQGALPHNPNAYLKLQTEDTAESIEVRIAI